MSIPIEFLNAIVKRSALDRVYPGGSAAYISDHGAFDGRVRAYDEYLVKVGAMSPDVIKMICDSWTELGLTDTTEVSGIKQWEDFCVVDELMGPTLKCDWIIYDPKNRKARHIAEPHQN